MFHKRLFENAFGIIYDASQPPQTILLAFTYEQGQYVKNYPLHHSQKVTEETQDGVLIELTMIITHDLIMELLSYGENIKVIVPASLIKQVRGIYENVLKKYG